MPGNAPHRAATDGSSSTSPASEGRLSVIDEATANDVAALPWVVQDPSAQTAVVRRRRVRRESGGPQSSRLQWLRVHPWLTGTTAVVVLVGAGLGIYFGTRGSAPAAAATTTVATVTTGTIRQSVSATGSLAPAEQENLNFAVSGEVTSVRVSAGQIVKKGQTLATVESASLSATVAQAEAAVASDKAKVDADDDVSDTQLAADKAALTAAKNQLASAKAQLAAATMTSPIDGAVAEVNLTLGESVSGNGSIAGSGTGSTSGATTSGSSTSSSSSAEILVITTNSWIVNATVDATSVGLIKTGQQAQLTVTGASDVVYGTIASIGLVSSSSSGTASYPVVIDVTGSPSGLHDGASVTAALIYKQVSNAVVVSTLALHRNTSGSQYVEKQVNGKAVQTPVQVGISSGGQTQITSGLSAGDKIVVPQLRRTTGGTSTGTRGTNGTGTFPGGGDFPGGGAGAGGPGGGFGGGGFGG
jgi:macrolide-specific efflux system membrane fusion protein